MSAANPVGSRLDRLHDQWVEFAERPDARVLRWLVRGDEVRMVQTFVASECDDRAGDLPDLFVTLPQPFADVNAYGADLRAGLLAQYDGARADMAEEGLDAAWAPPPAAVGVHSLGHLLEACASLRAHYPEMAHLALVLLPSAVADYGEWQRWLAGAATHAPEGVRFVVIDGVDAPALEPLARADPARVHTVAADADVPGLLVELAAQGGTTTPDGRFRAHFTAMSAALGAGDRAAAQRAGDAARAVADGEGWHHLVSAVHFALAGGLAAKGETDAAVAEYQAADAAGKRQAEVDEALGARLRLNAALGVGSVLVGQREFARAAGVYEAAAPMGQKVGDPYLLLECWRMAAYCREQAGDWAAAWKLGFTALDAAEGIAPPDRAHSTVPYVRDGLLRLAGGSAPHATAVQARVDQLMAGPAVAGARP